jgi:DNA-binding MarR family transcriptional regulator
MAAGRAMSSATVIFHAAVAEKVGLSATEDKAVELLDRLGPLTPGELGKHSGLTSASVTALIDRLERKGFAKQTPHPRDRRRVLVEVIPERTSSVSALLTTWVAALHEVLDGFDDEQLETILRFLNHATRRQQELTTELTNTCCGLRRRTGQRGARSFSDRA